MNNTKDELGSLWSLWCDTPKEIIQEEKIKNRKIKTVSSIHRMKKATEILGLYGLNWGIKDLRQTKFQIGNLVMAEVDAIFFVDNSKFKFEFEISNSTAITSREEDGKISFNSMYRKSLETDLINKALSRLGLFADIYADTELIKAEGEAKEDELLGVDFVELGE